MPYIPLNRIPWGTKLPEKRTPFIPLLSPKQGQKVRGIILGHSVTKIGTHYLDERTVPCLEDPAICEGCAKGMIPRWFAYLPIGALPHGRISCLSITTGAARMEPRLKDETIDLRGWHIEATRGGKGIRGPVKVILDPRQPSANLPPGFDVRAFLINLWGMKGPQDGNDGQAREV
jgi:hypothetical protein